MAIVGVNPLTAFMAVKRGRIEYVRDLGAAPGAFAFGLAEADHGAENRGKNAAYDHGNTEDCAEAGEAQHRAYDEAHWRYDYAEEHAAECASHGRFFRFN